MPEILLLHAAPPDTVRHLPRCGRGGIGRRAALRSLWGNPWKFESSRPHQRNPLRRVFSFLANRLALTPQDARLRRSQFGYRVLSCRQRYKNYGRQIIDPTPPELNGRTELASVTLSVPDTVGVHPLPDPFATRFHDMGYATSGIRPERRLRSAIRK